MEKEQKPENLKIFRKKSNTLLGALLSLLLAGALIGLFFLAYFNTGEEAIQDVRTAFIISAVGLSVASLFFLVNAALCINNLRYPLILASDEKGLYDYSGYIHSGFIPWDDIEKINGGGKKIETALDLLADGDVTAVRIDLKNYKRTFSGKSGLWKLLYFLSGFGCTKIQTLCSPLSKKQTYALLAQRLDYYASTDIK